MPSGGSEARPRSGCGSPMLPGSMAFLRACRQCSISGRHSCTIRSSCGWTRASIPCASSRDMLDAGKEARRRVLKNVQKRLTTGPTKMDYLGIEQLADMVSQFAFRLQRSVEEPILNFRHVVGKIAYSLSVLMRLASLMMFVVGIGLIENLISQTWFARQISWTEALKAAAAIGWIQIPLLVIAIIIIRRLLIRMGEPDRQPPSQN